MYPVFDKKIYKIQAKQNILKVPIRFFCDLKYCMQRIRKGYCDKDVSNIDYWFLNLLPDMLQEHKEVREGSPATLIKDEDGNDVVADFETCQKQWDETLDRLIFLLREASETTCTRKNPHEQEYFEMYDEFCEKYGMFEKIEGDIGNDCGFLSRMEDPSEVPEYAGLQEKYFAEENKIEAYRNECKNEALKIFSEHFWEFWD